MPLRLHRQKRLDEREFVFQQHRSISWGIDMQLFVRTVVPVDNLAIETYEGEHGQKHVQESPFNEEGEAEKMTMSICTWCYKKGHHRKES